MSSSGRDFSLIIPVENKIIWEHIVDRACRDMPECFSCKYHPERGFHIVCKSIYGGGKTEISVSCENAKKIEEEEEEDNNNNRIEEASDSGDDEEFNQIKIQVVNSNNALSLFPPAMMTLCEYIYNARRDLRFKYVKRQLVLSFDNLSKEGKTWADYHHSPPPTQPLETVEEEEEMPDLVG